MTQTPISRALTSTPAAMDAIVLRFSPQSTHSEHLMPSRKPDIFSGHFTHNWSSSAARSYSWLRFLRSKAQFRTATQHYYKRLHPGSTHSSEGSFALASDKCSHCNFGKQNLQSFLPSDLKDGLGKYEWKWVPRYWKLVLADLPCSYYILWFHESYSFKWVL